MSENGPKERLSEFFCNLMEDNREIIDNIYNKLPIEVTNENENKQLKKKINYGRRGSQIGGGVVGAGVGALFYLVPVVGPLIRFSMMGFYGSVVAQLGGRIADNTVDNSIKEETLKAIKNSFKSSIEIVTKNIINEYKLINHQHCKLIKGENILKLIEDMEKKIIQPEKDQNISIVIWNDSFIFKLEKSL